MQCECGLLNTESDFEHPITVRTRTTTYEGWYHPNESFFDVSVQKKLIQKAEYEGKIVSVTKHALGIRASVKRCPKCKVPVKKLLK